jgi:type IV secretory pathway VirB3-like protein
VACFSSSLRVAHEEVVSLGKAGHTLVERSTHLIGRLLLLLLLLLQVAGKDALLLGVSMCTLVLVKQVTHTLLIGVSICTLVLVKQVRHAIHVKAQRASAEEKRCFTLLYYCFTTACFTALLLQGAARFC